MHKCIFDGMIANIKRFAEEVFSGKDEDFKSRLLDELELITKMGTKTKRSPMDDLNPNTNKKLKIDPKRNVELPNGNLDSNHEEFTIQRYLWKSCTCEQTF